MRIRGVPVLSFIVALVLGCSDDSTGPDRGLALADIEGGWEVIHKRVDSVVIDLPDNYGFWYFAEDGSYCSLSRTAYGTYLEGYSGTVSAKRSVLTVHAFAGEEIDWALSLSTTADTLYADRVVPDTSGDDGRILVRGVDAPEPICFH